MASSSIVTVARFAIFLHFSPHKFWVQFLGLLSHFRTFIRGFQSLQKLYTFPEKNKILTLQINIWQPKQRANYLAVLAQHYRTGASCTLGLNKVSFRQNFYKRVKTDRTCVRDRQRDVVSMKIC